MVFLYLCDVGADGRNAGLNSTVIGINDRLCCSDLGVGVVKVFDNVIMELDLVRPCGRI